MGKSTVARDLAQRFDPAVYIESDWFFHAIVTGWIAPWDRASHTQNAVVKRMQEKWPDAKTFVAVERYLRRCELKTAALFEAACRLGALVAVDGTDALADELGAFARRIGLAFQMLDDVLDVSGPVERTGKARGTDLLEGTVTLPFILARERERELAGFQLRSLAGPRQAEALCERIAATGALDEARERALAVVAEAKSALPDTLPDGRSLLLDLVADAVVERYR